MKAVGKHVIIDVSIKNNSSLLIPDTMPQIRNDYTGKVYQVGEEVKIIKSGDEVAFRQGSMVWSNGKGLLAVLEENVVAIL